MIELGQLRERLVRERRVALSGMGGVGKSQLAIEYLHRHRDDPERQGYVDGVFWLRGESAATLTGDFAALAWLPPLELDERQQREQERVIEAVARWLQVHVRWLLVIDNLDEAAVPTLNGLLGRGLQGQVLVTSRVPLWDSTRLAVEPMSPEVAVAFLLERSGETDAAAAAEVAEIVGGLPLALVQAASYVKTSGRDLESYARLVHTRLTELLQEGRPEDYPLTVAATWKLSFERIQREQPSAAALLRLCAFMAPDDIPLSILLEGAAELPDELRGAVRDEVRLDGAVVELLRYALVDRQGDGLSVHRLVQAVVQDSMIGDLTRWWLGAAIRVLREAFPAEVRDPMRATPAQLWTSATGGEPEDGEGVPA